MGLHHGNLLSDNKYNIAGVIDWGRAQTVPLERLAVSLELIFGPLCSCEHKGSIARLFNLMRDSLRDAQSDAGFGKCPNNRNQPVPKPNGGCDANEGIEAKADRDDVDL